MNNASRYKNRPFSQHPIASIICLGALLPILVNYGIKYYPFEHSGKSSDWFAFWGSYLGGIITLLAIWITIKENRHVFADNLRMKLIESDVDSLTINHKAVNLIYSEISPFNRFFEQDPTIRETQLSSMHQRISYMVTIQSAKQLFKSKEAHQAFIEYEMIIKAVFEELENAEQNTISQADLQSLLQRTVWKVVNSHHDFSKRISNICTILHSHASPIQEDK